MALLEDLRKKRIYGPTSRQFDASKWLDMRQKDGVTADEVLLIDTGLYIHDTLNKLRSRLNFTQRRDVLGAYKKVGIIYHVNRDCLQVEVDFSRSVVDLAERGTLSMDALSSKRIALPAGEFSADDIAESANDTGDALLQLISEDDTGVKSDANFKASDVRDELRIAFAYRATEDLWLDVVWHSYRMSRSNDEYRFVAEDVASEEIRTRSLYRHIMQMAQAVTFAAGQLETPRHPDLKDSLAESAMSRMLDERALIRSVGTAPYYASKFDEVGPRHPRLTLRLITNAFDVLSIEIEHHCLGILEKLRGMKKGASEAGVINPTEYACVIDKGSIICRISTDLGVDLALANEILDFLTLGGGQNGGRENDDIWSAPCVNVDDHYVAFAEHPLRRGNVLRLIDIWLRKLGFNLDFRGNGFEIYARESLAMSSRRSALKELTSVFDRDFTFKDATGRPEEVDLLILVGQHLLVGELKCFLAPTTPLDWSNHQDKIVEAVVQVGRKAAAIRSSQAQFLARAKQLRFDLPENLSIVPVVVLNHAIGAGQVIDNIPVVDLRIVEMYFEGELASFGVYGPGGTVEHGPAVAFYQNPDAAGAGLSDYLHAPPQLSHLKKAIRSRAIAIHASEFERLYTIDRIEVDGQAVLENAFSSLSVSEES